MKAIYQKVIHYAWRSGATLFLLGTLITLNGPAQEASAAAKPAPAPQGVIKEFSFTNSVIFPGTLRQGWVFIPAQYDGSQPACVYVKQDGYNSREKGFLETMIAAGEMPVTIGIFIRPGELPAPTKGTPGRRNRCFEYDGVSDAYARFLATELLPYVAREFNLKLSTNGNDHCIAGASSGGICAFNVAWERPDLFTRVYACSGSFVAFRGGHEYPILIRKFEPQPVRAYLTTGTDDMVNCAGHWFLLDQEMDQALKFSGYDYQFRIIDGRHCAGYNENFCEAMRFIWKGWPQPVLAGAGAPRFQDIAISNETWQLAAQGFHDARGPACNAKGEVFFLDVPANTCYRLGGDGKANTFLADAGHANSLTIGVHGELYAASYDTGNIIRYDATGKGTLVAKDIRTQYVLARPDGALYATTAGEHPNETSKVWLLKDGKSREVDSGLKFATGLAYRPDQWLLAVADGHSKWIYSYQIKSDGTLINKERFFWLHVPDWEDDAGPESLCYAQEGQLFAATRFGIQVCADDGPTQVILPMPDHSRVNGVCLGGPNLDTLYAFCGDKIWKRKVKVHALGAFSPWLKAQGSHL